MATGAFVHAEAVSGVLVALHATEASVRLTLWNVRVRIGVVSLANFRSGSLRETVCETNVQKTLFLLHTNKYFVKHCGTRKTKNSRKMFVKYIPVHVRINTSIHCKQELRAAGPVMDEPLLQRRHRNYKCTCSNNCYVRQVLKT